MACGKGRGGGRCAYLAAQGVKPIRLRRKRTTVGKQTQVWNPDTGPKAVRLPHSIAGSRGANRVALLRREFGRLGYAVGGSAPCCLVCFWVYVRLIPPSCGDFVHSEHRLRRPPSEGAAPATAASANQSARLPRVRLDAHALGELPHERVVVRAAVQEAVALAAVTRAESSLALG